MEETKTTIKIEQPKRNFIILYDSVYKNNNLTSEEMHLLIKLISKAPNFKPTTEKLADILHMNKRALNKASKGLQEKGYLIIKKFGKNSEWIITQEPLIEKIGIYNKETLLNGLLNYVITIEDINLYHKLKRIDDRLYIEITEEYAKEITRRAKYNVYEE